MGIPVELAAEAVTIGFSFKCRFILPKNITDYQSIFVEPLDIYGTRPLDSGSFRSDDMNQYRHARAMDHQVNGYDSEQNERFEKYISRAEVVDSGRDAEFDDSGKTVEDDINVENDEMNGIDNDMNLNEEGPTNLATVRWTFYKGLAALAQRLCIDFGLFFFFLFLTLQLM